MGIDSLVLMCGSVHKKTFYDIKKEHIHLGLRKNEGNPVL